MKKNNSDQNNLKSGHPSLSLAEFFNNVQTGHKAPHLSSFAHLIIDPQRYYTDPSFTPRTRGTAHTKERSLKLSNVTPLFRQAGIKTFIVYYDAYLNEGLERSMGGPYMIRPQKSDFLVAKTQSDAFESSSLDSVLQLNGIKNLLVSGFNTTACVFYTACSAQKNGYKTAILEDCTGQDGHFEDDIPKYIALMMRQGIHRTHSKEALEYLSTL